MNLSPRVFLFSALAAFSGWGCFGSSPADPATQSATKGPFEALSANMSDGDIWALNRPLRFFFNHVNVVGNKKWIFDFRICINKQ